jgi:mRNA-degrading endonuclease toxin of MazEF toxin-antitoxin module
MQSKYDLGNVWWIPHNKIQFPDQILKEYDCPVITVLENSLLSVMIVPGTSGTPGNKCTIRIEPDESVGLKKTGYFLTRFVQPMLKKNLKNHRGLLPDALKDQVADKVRGKLLKKYGVIIS